MGNIIREDDGFHKLRTTELAGFSVTIDSLIAGDHAQMEEIAGILNRLFRAPGDPSPDMPVDYKSVVILDAWKIIEELRRYEAMDDRRGALKTLPPELRWISRFIHLEKDEP